MSSSSSIFTHETKNMSLQKETTPIPPMPLDTKGEKDVLKYVLSLCKGYKSEDNGTQKGGKGVKSKVERDELYKRFDMVKNIIDINVCAWYD
jgi:hypothetical protein